MFRAETGEEGSNTTKLTHHKAKLIWVTVNVQMELVDAEYDSALFVLINNAYKYNMLPLMYRFFK